MSHCRSNDGTRTLFKVAIISPSMLTKHNRMDAEYFLGGAVSQAEKELRLAEAAVKKAKTRTKNARKKVKRQRARMQKLIADGDITVIQEVPRSSLSDASGSKGEQGLLPLEIQLQKGTL